MLMYDIDLYKDSNNSLGLSLMGDPTAGIFVKSVQPIDGSAARSGRIQTGLQPNSWETCFISVDIHRRSIADDKP